MRDLPRALSALAPKRQRNWDERAATNFICGGTGGGLMLAAALTAPAGQTAWLQFLGLALVGLGLLAVWLEIGRPLRALNVYRHAKTSWMTREALVAPLLFLCGLLAVLPGPTFMDWVAGLVGAAFVYSQARILQADKGIPAWRHPRSLPLVFCTGLAEGAGIALSARALDGGSFQTAAALLVLLLALRALAWRRYLAALRTEGAPREALRALAQLDHGFLWAANGMPFLFVLAALLTGLPIFALVAGLAAVTGGAVLKYTLVCKAAYTQGFALPHLPVRGQGSPGAGVKPGWVAN